MPALLTSRSSFPKFSTALATIRSASAEAVTSPVSDTARPPLPPKSQRPSPGRYLPTGRRQPRPHLLLQAVWQCPCLFPIPHRVISATLSFRRIVRTSIGLSDKIADRPPIQENRFASRTSRQPRRRPRMSSKRVVVLGTSGSGKTTFARELASRLGVPHVEFDAYRHGPELDRNPQRHLQTPTGRGAVGRLSGWQTATTVSPGTSSGPGPHRSSGWTTGSLSSSGACGGAQWGEPCTGPSCGTATGRVSGNTSSQRTRSSSGYSRPTGRGAADTCRLSTCRSIVTCPSCDSGRPGRPRCGWIRCPPTTDRRSREALVPFPDENDG